MYTMGMVNMFPYFKCCNTTLSPQNKLVQFLLHCFISFSMYVFVYYWFYESMMLYFSMSI